jgi:hypothetical protein
MFLPSSPSFNDFSLGCQEAAEEGSTAYAQSLPTGLPVSGWAGRRSFEGATEKTSHVAAQRWRLATAAISEGLGLKHDSAPAGTSTGIPIPQGRRAFDNHQQQTEQAEVPGRPGRRKYRNNKIDGLDYYDYCELIRSSSL